MRVLQRALQAVRGRRAETKVQPARKQCGGAVRAGQAGAVRLRVANAVYVKGIVSAFVAEINVVRGVEIDKRTVSMSRVAFQLVACGVTAACLTANVTETQFACSTFVRAVRSPCCPECAERCGLSSRPRVNRSVERRAKRLAGSGPRAPA